jgi:hypothetical protein
MPKDPTGLANTLVKSRALTKRATSGALAEALAAAHAKAVTKKKGKVEFTGNQTVLEYRVKQAVKDRLDAIGAYHFWPVQTGLGSACIDCIGCYNGMFFGIETKATGKVPSARQELIMAEMRAAGAEVLVIDSEAAAKNLFIEIIEKGVHARLQDQE